ncbi:MAG: extracellular solute-binding protein [Acetatifactor sp.]|nr:extracellular solute-binding protein [Acetatifactor sp.]
MKRIVSLALILCLFLTGCGQVVKTKSGKDSDIEYVYRSESCSVEGMDDGFAFGLTKDDTWLCAAMVMTDWESGRDKSWIACYNAKNGKTKRIEPDGEEGTVLLEIAAGKNGEFWGISFWMELGGDVKLSVNRYAKNGKILASNDLTALLGQDGAQAIYWLYGNCLQIDQNGNLYLAYKDVENPGNSVLLSFSPEGQILFHTGVEGTVQRLILADNGKLYAAVKRMDNTMEILTADTVSGETETLIKDLPQNEINTILAASRDGKKLYYNVSGYLYEYDVAEGKNRGLFALSDVPLFEQELVGMVQTDADHFYFLSNAADENGISEGEWSCVRRVRADQAKPIQDREVLTLAMFAEDADVTQTVAAFNRKSDTHKIEIRLYGGLSETDGAERLQADIASGKIPDIIDLAGVDGMAYIRQGIVTDLTPLLEESSEISEEDFVEKAISTYRDGEGLYAIPTNFWLGSMVGKTSCLGGRSGWTLEEFREYADALPNPGAATASDSKENMLDWIMMQYAERYIDWESGTCSFDSEEFLELLDFVNRFPDEVTDNAEQFVEQIRSEEILLNPMTIQYVDMFQLNRAIFDDEVTYIGFPSESGNGTKMMILRNAFGISQNCKDKEAAWEFLKTLYTSDANIIGRFPVYKPSLEKAFEFASTGVYRTDENADRTKNPKYYYYYGGLTIEIYAATDEEIRQIRSLIENAEPADIRTPGIYTIMQEEAEAFFAGQRSAEETAEAMQGRVALYINEHR